MANELLNLQNQEMEIIDFVNLDIDEENIGSVRRIEEGFNKLDSKWILGFNATRYRYGKWIITWTFNPFTTNGKANPGGKSPVTQFGVETREILKLQKATSPGKFYIENVALKPNASGHGGHSSWRYASSTYGDVVKNFINQGVDGLIGDVKEIVIPEALQNHLTSVNRTISKLKNPTSSLYNLAHKQTSTLMDETPEFKRFFRLTKDKIEIGVNVAETIISPEARIGREFWGMANKKARSFGKSFYNKENKKLRKNISNKIL